MFKTVMIIAFVVLGLGWIAYWIWSIYERRLEQKTPRKRSETFEQAKSSVSEYAQKMKEFEQKRKEEMEKRRQAREQSSSQDQKQ